MKVIIISTTVYPLPPPGYSGLEMLCYNWAVEFQKLGVQVAVIAPEGSKFPEGIELIPVGVREAEEGAYVKHKKTLEDRLKDGWVCMDNTWAWFSVLSQMEADHQLPIVHVYHSDVAFLGSPPPIKYPCIVSLSKSQGELLSNKWSVMTRKVYNGIDLSFYKPDPEVKRGDRYLFVGRYTPEKCPLDAIFLAKKCRVPLDLFGDMEIIANQDYLRKCFEENDGRQIRVNPGISREEVVKQMQSHKALIHIVNYNEAFGLVPVECMATGTPVIVNRRGALSELVKHGKTGFVVDSLESAEELIRTDAVSRIKPEDCRKQAMKFSLEKSAKGHLRAMEDVANNIYW